MSVHLYQPSDVMCDHTSWRAGGGLTRLMAEGVGMRGRREDGN